MEIGKTYPIKDSNFPKPKSLKNLTILEKRQALDALQDFDDLKDENLTQGIRFPKVVSRYGSPKDAVNTMRPDPHPPAELFNFDLILNGRRFSVMCETILRIKSEEDLVDYSEIQLARLLEQVASYRVTCFCAYIGAHREHRKWKEYHTVWFAEKRTEARNILRTRRIADKAASLRKDLGQITMQEIEDYILTHYNQEYKENVEMIAEWEDNERVFLELRDTLKDRGMHLQSLLKRVTDNTDKSIKGYEK